MSFCAYIERLCCILFAAGACGRPICDFLSLANVNFFVAEPNDDYYRY